MDVWDSFSSYDLFVNPLQQQLQLESISNQALSRGIDLFVKKDYAGAATEFHRAINLNPNSQYMVDASKHLVQTYLKLDKTDKAVTVYQDAVKRRPDRDDLYAELGNILYSQDRHAEALNAYQNAVRINPSATNQYSLGQALLQLDRHAAAKDAFNRVIRLEPNSAHGYFGLGQAYARDGDWRRAIEQFEKAISKKSDQYDAYAEMGYAYADMGDIDKAREIAGSLESKDAELFALLDTYIDKVESPKISFAWGTSSFRYRMSAGTPVAALDAYLQNANAATSFTMKFQFNKEMDRSSIGNRLNWSISRAMGTGPAQSYNFGESVSQTEVSISSLPDYVLYDAETLIATVGFTIRQNSSADGTIDPCHISFKFKGKDAVGISMDPAHDEFTGFSKVA